MRRNDGGTTSPTLLRRVGDWDDLPAWHEFVARYDPLLRRWCREYRLDDDATGEVCQRVWVELAERMRGFRYDPGRRFRGWLRGVCRCRAIDLMRERQREGRLVRPLGEVPGDEARLIGRPAEPAEGEDDEPDARRSLLLQEAEQAQAAVRSRVDPRTWDIFWRIAVDGRTVGETAAAFGVSYAAAFAAHRRVDQKLRKEGDQRLAALSDTDTNR
jgi:RNA polymerase sigma-70 factor (ECF subfamily)